MRKHKLVIAITHPIQYHAPLYTYLAKDGRFDLDVIFMSDRGARPFYDKFARTMVSYDNPLLEGYRHEFLRRGDPKGFWEEKTEFYRVELVRRIGELRPDAVYFHGYDNPVFWPAIALCRRRGITVLFRGENEDVIARPAWRNALREAFLRLFLPNVDGFLYIGQRNKEFLLRRGVPEARLFYVPYSVDNDYFEIDTAERERLRVEIRQRYQLPASEKLFIYTRKLRETMRPLDAVKAFCDAIPLLPRPATLIVCGDGDQREEAEAIANARGNGQVRFAGFLSQSDLRAHMLAADVMVNPTEEPWGCAVNEGLASGLAQVASDRVVGWPDMVHPDVNGVVYTFGNLAKLRDSIVKLAALPDADLAKFRQASLELSRKLSFATCANGLSEAITTLRSSDLNGRMSPEAATH